MLLRMDRYRPDNVPTPFRQVRNRLVPLSGGLPAFALLLGISLAAIAPVHAQLKSKVTIEPAQPKAMVYTTSIGIIADRWDPNPYDPATVQLLKDAGITSLRFPGNGGVDALYHFSTGTITNPYSNDRIFAFPDTKKFPALAGIINQLGSGLVQVNYGSNLDGSGGGEPAEAAAWVAYANGSPSSTQVIGKDSEGNDWKTVGFWASLRAATPLAKDDGYNHLRIGLSDPIGIQLWTIGDSVAGNGFYGGDPVKGNDADSSGRYQESGSPEPDLHAGKVNDSRAWYRHENNPKISPQAYGQAVVEFAKAMKAVDPAILIGASYVIPPISSDPHPFGKGWNAGVLKAACASIDFGFIGFGEGAGAPPDWVNYLAEDDLLDDAFYMGDSNRHMHDFNGLGRDYVLLAGDLQEKYKKLCPAGHAPQIAVTYLGVPAWLPVKNPSAVGMFAADAVATLLEYGAYTVMWSPVHGPVGANSPSFLDSKNVPQPGYYGLKLLHQIVQPGDVFVSATVNNNNSPQTLAVHAVKRRDGGLGLLLINKDPSQSAAVTLTVSGYNYATKGTRYDWGKFGPDAGNQITQTPIDNLGGTFTVQVPRYSMAAIVIPKAQ